MSSGKIAITFSMPRATKLGDDFPAGPWPLVKWQWAWKVTCPAGIIYPSPNLTKSTKKCNCSWQKHKVNIIIILLIIVTFLQSKYWEHTVLFCHLPTPLHCPLKCSYSIDFNLLIVCNNLFQFTSVIPLHGRSFLNRCANKNNGNAKKMRGKASTKRIKVNDENAARQVGLRKSATKDHKKII